MNGWRDIKLKEVSEYVTVGFVGSMADQYVEAGVPFLRSLNIQPFRLNYNDLKYISESFHDSIKKSKLRPGDVGIVRTGYPGTACVIPADLPDANCSDLVILRPGPELNPHYITAVFNSAFGQSLVGGNLVGAAQQHFNVTVAKELKLRLPPRVEQDKIAAVLVGLNDLIANNQRRIALLESMAEEIYREWFVRMRFPGASAAERKKGLPSGWRVCSIDDLFITSSGGTPSRSNPANFSGTIPWVKTGELKQTFISATEECISETGLESSAAKLLPARTIVMAMYCAMPDVAVLDVAAATNQACCALTPRSKRLGVTWSYFFARNALSEMVNFAHGAAQQNLSQEIIRKFKVLAPDESVIEQFGAIANPFFEEVAVLYRQNAVLRATRDALLPRLISGKLRVDALDIKFPPSMQSPPEEAAQAISIKQGLVHSGA